MKEQFVTYEIALALKELGFDEPYLAYYRGWIEKWDESTNSYKRVKELQITTDVSGWNTEVIQAPLWQQVIDWLREKYGLHIDIDFGLGWGYGFIPVGCILNYDWSHFEENKNWGYPEARETAILSALELIKNHKL